MNYIQLVFSNSLMGDGVTSSVISVPGFYQRTKSPVLR